MKSLILRQVIIKVAPGFFEILIDDLREKFERAIPYFDNALI